MENVFSKLGEPFYKWESEAQSGVSSWGEGSSGRWLTLHLQSLSLPALKLFCSRSWKSMWGEKDLGHDEVPFPGEFLLIEEK